MSTPHCFPFRDILFVLNYIHFPVKGHRWIRGSLKYYLGEPHIFFFFAMTITVIAADRWFSSCTPVSSANENDRHDIAEMVLKVALNTIVLTPFSIDGF
jgi:hypothetical protein